MTSRRQWLGAALGFGLSGSVRGSSVLETLSHTEPCMGTLFTVRAVHPEEDEGYTAIAAAFRRMRAIDAALSDYCDDSELNELCRTGHARPFVASDDLFRVLRASLSLAQSTGGAFDVTLGPLVRQWRAARMEGRLPDEKAIESARARTGWQGVALDASKRTVKLPREGMQLDFGGVAKGYAADEALTELRRHGVTAALVAAGGDIAVSAPPPGQRAWHVAIEAGAAGVRPSVLLASQAVSTSGNLHQFAEIGGVRYSHILDPETGLGLTRPITVSVVASTAMASDSTATALSVMGLSHSQEWLRQHPAVQARIVSKGQDGTADVWQTPGFPLAPHANVHR
ncbi:MAG: FAD:protein FMN transferase [Bryobacterales bacterium]|nr:FAD:protein FMN transferase [Bryobacterales bacterium]